MEKNSTRFPQRSSNPDTRTTGSIVKLLETIRWVPLDRGQIRIFQTWPWTRDYAPVLFAAVAAFVLLPLVLGEVAYRSAFGWGNVALAASAGPSAADLLLRYGAQTLQLMVPSVFAAAISATAYRAWAPKPDAEDA